jgi:SH3-like domain-containing protein
MITCTFSGIRKNQIENHHEAIVMSGVITAKSSPDKSGTDLFQLHEGTKVEVKSTLGNWIEIEIGNGSVGWVEKIHTETI